MQVSSYSGETLFYISNNEVQYLEDFLDNKVLIGIESNNRMIYGFKQEVPNLLTAGATYFGKKAERDFFSLFKKAILKELGVYEREEGVFLEYEGNVITSIYDGVTLTWNGLIYPFDKVEAGIIKTVNYSYNVFTKSSEGFYGI